MNRNALEHCAICEIYHFESNKHVKGGLYMYLLYSDACEEQAA